MNNFGDIEAIKVIFFSKCSKFDVHFENRLELWENVDRFQDNCVWTCFGSLDQL